MGTMIGENAGRVVVIPAYNEARTIGSVVLQSLRHAERVIVVDDGSTDATAEVARLAGAEVFAHDRNRGKGAAVKTGLSSLSEGRVVALLDADGQHDPSSLPELFAPIEAGDADLVVGERSAPGDGRPSRGRRFGRRMLDGATNGVSRSGVTDTQSGYRAFRIDTLGAVLPRETGMGMESEMLARAKKAGHRIVGVPVAEHYPSGLRRPHMHPLAQARAVFDSLLRFVREEHPLAFFGGMGIVFIAWGMWSGYQTATHYYATNVFWPGKAMVAMLTLILGTIGVLGGMILDYLNLRLPRR